MSATDQEQEGTPGADRLTRIVFRYIEDEPVGTVLAAVLVVMGIIGGLSLVSAAGASLSIAAIALLVVLISVGVRQRWKNPFVDAGIGFSVALVGQAILLLTKIL